MNWNWAQIGVAVFGSGGVFAVVMGIVNVMTGRDSRQAEVAKSLSETAAALVEPLETQLTKVTDKLERVVEQREADRQRLAVMQEQINALTPLARAVAALTALVDIAAPLIQAEHPDLAAELAARSSVAAEAAAAARRAIDGP